MRQDAKEDREGRSAMTRTQAVVMLVASAVLLVGALSGCKQHTEVAEVPVADVVSPGAEEVPAAEPTPPETEFKVPDGWVVPPENDRAEGEVGYRILHEETGIELVYVPGGTFMMGSAGGDPDAHFNGKPQHEHTIRALWIGRTEVTAGQWQSVMGSVPDEGNHQGEDHPVVEVSWDEATEFCGKLGLELPTEAQWEYAARGPESLNFPWGDEWDEEKCCNELNEGPGGKTSPVGSLPRGASWCGALDMAGNVWEHCADWYDEDAYERYATGDLTPPSTGFTRVLRGGSWRGRDSVEPYRCAYRGFRAAAFYRYDDIGLRCALSAD